MKQSYVEYLQNSLEEDFPRIVESGLHKIYGAMLLSNGSGRYLNECLELLPPHQRVVETDISALIRLAGDLKHRYWYNLPTSNSWPQNLRHDLIKFLVDETLYLGRYYLDHITTSESFEPCSFDLSRCVNGSTSFDSHAERQGFNYVGIMHDQPVYLRIMISDHNQPYSVWLLMPFKNLTADILCLNETTAPFGKQTSQETVVINQQETFTASNFASFEFSISINLPIDDSSYKQGILAGTSFCAILENQLQQHSIPASQVTAISL